MKFFIDFEATQENEIVSVGITSESGKTYYSLVKPEFSSISQFISDLIHIKEQDLEEANSLDTVFTEIFNWTMEQSNCISDWEFFSFTDTDKTFIEDSFRNLKNNNAILFGSYLIANIKDAYFDIKHFFNGSISLINGFNYITQENKKQIHNALEDAKMLQTVYEYIKTHETLSCLPTIKKEDVSVKMPSGTFSCTTGGKKSKIREFKDIDEAIDWYINTHIAVSQRSSVKKENIMNRIMVSVKKKEKYNQYYWSRKK